MMMLERNEQQVTTMTDDGASPPAVESQPFLLILSSSKQQIASSDDDAMLCEETKRWEQFLHRFGIPYEHRDVADGNEEDPSPPLSYPHVRVGNECFTTLAATLERWNEVKPTLNRTASFRGRPPLMNKPSMTVDPSCDEDTTSVTSSCFSSMWTMDSSDGSPSFRRSSVDSSDRSPSFRRSSASGSSLPFCVEEESEREQDTESEASRSLNKTTSSESLQFFGTSSSGESGWEDTDDEDDDDDYSTGIGSTTAIYDYDNQEDHASHHEEPSENMTDEELEFLHASLCKPTPPQQKEEEEAGDEETKKNQVLMSDGSDRWSDEGDAEPPSLPLPMPPLVPCDRSNTPTHLLARRYNLNLLDDVASLESQSTEGSLSNEDLLSSIKRRRGSSNSRPNSDTSGSGQRNNSSTDTTTMMAPSSSRHPGDSFSTWSTNSFSDLDVSLHSSAYLVPLDHDTNSASTGPRKSMQNQQQGSSQSLLYPLPSNVVDGIFHVRQNRLLEKRLGSLRGRFTEEEQQGSSKDGKDCVPSVPSRTHSGSSDGSRRNKEEDILSDDDDDRDEFALDSSKGTTDESPGGLKPDEGRCDHHQNHASLLDLRRMPSMATFVPIAEDDELFYSESSATPMPELSESWGNIDTAEVMDDKHQELLQQPSSFDYRSPSAPRGHDGIGGGDLKRPVWRKYDSEAGLYRSDLSPIVPINSREKVAWQKSQSCMDLSPTAPVRNTSHDLSKQKTEDFQIPDLMAMTTPASPLASLSGDQSPTAPVRTSSAELHQQALSASMSDNQSLLVPDLMMDSFPEASDGVPTISLRKHTPDLSRDNSAASLFAPSDVSSLDHCDPVVQDCSDEPVLNIPTTGLDTSLMESPQRGVSRRNSDMSPVIPIRNVSVRTLDCDLGTEDNDEPPKEPSTDEDKGIPVNVGRSMSPELELSSHGDLPSLASFSRHQVDEKYTSGASSLISFASSSFSSSIASSVSSCNDEGKHSAEFQDPSLEGKNPVNRSDAEDTPPKAPAMTWTKTPSSRKLSPTMGAGIQTLASFRKRSRRKIFLTDDIQNSIKRHSRGKREPAKPVSPGMGSSSTKNSLRLVTPVSSDKSSHGTRPRGLGSDKAGSPLKGKGSPASDKAQSEQAESQTFTKCEEATPECDDVVPVPPGSPMMCREASKVSVLTDDGFPPRSASPPLVEPNEDVSVKSSLPCDTGRKVPLPERTIKKSVSWAAESQVCGEVITAEVQVAEDDSSCSSTVRTNHLTLNNSQGDVSKADLSVSLPNGETASVAEITRLLLQFLPRHRAIKSGKVYFYFKGSEGIYLWRQLFFDSNPEIPEEEIVEWGRSLERSIVWNLTPENVYKDAILVLQPLREPNVLNSFLLWPDDDSEDSWRPCKDAEVSKAVFDLSRMMDGIFLNKSGLKNFDQSKVRKFEAAVCQLQVLKLTPDTFHSEQERTCFALNLVNLMIRHALLLHFDASSKQFSSWPKSLPELERVLGTEIIYNIGGDLVSALDVHEALFQNQDISPGSGGTLEVSAKVPWWRTFDCRKSQSVLSPADERLVFCVTYGTLSSPNVMTVSPFSLESHLQSAARSYCQEHVVVECKRYFCNIKLPQLFHWHPTLLAGAKKANDVVEKLLCNLSPDHVATLQMAHDKKWRVRFRHYNWKVRGLKAQPKVPMATAVQLKGDVCDGWGNQKRESEARPKPNLLHRPCTPLDKLESTPWRYQDVIFRDDQSVNPSIVSAITYGSEWWEPVHGKTHKRWEVDQDGAQKPANCRLVEC